MLKLMISQDWFYSPLSDTVFLDYRDIFTIFQYDAIYRDIFQALNWSKKLVISSKVRPGSTYVEIFATEMPYFIIL